MPPRKAAIGKQTAKSKSVKEKRAAETAEERESRLQKNCIRISKNRTAETEEERESRTQQMRDRASLSRATETTQQRIKQLDAFRDQKSKSRKKTCLNLGAFNYNEGDDYRNHKDVVIGAMDKVCVHCGALKFVKESLGMCCSNGKVVLPPLIQPPEQLLSYISDCTPTSKHFLQNIRKYNSCFQMTSFGATSIVNNAEMLQEMESGII